MIATALAPAAAFQRAHASIKRSALRRKLEDVATGKTADITIDFDDSLVEPMGVIEEIARRHAADSAAMERLVAALVNSGAVDELIDALESRPIHLRASAVRALGALRMYDAVPWIAPLLAAPERPVHDAAARVLGVIGGAHSATAILAAIQRRGLNRRLVAELARSAPDHFVESAMSEALKPGLRPALALASGLRRRRTATAALTSLVAHGSRRERVISCRALGWIGASGAAPVIAEALNDRDWRIRMSAAKALGALRAGGAREQLREMHADRNPRVRRAAHAALRRIGAPVQPHAQAHGATDGA